MNEPLSLRNGCVPHGRSVVIASGESAKKLFLRCWGDTVDGKTKICFGHNSIRLTTKRSVDKMAWQSSSIMM
jgi:hypothetical protein